MKINSLNLKLLIRAHTILGLLAIFLFYLASYFGTITVFLPYVKSWESPSRHFVSIKENTKMDLDTFVPKIIKEKELSNIVEVWLPQTHEKALAINDDKSKTFYFDPNTYELLDNKNELNLISNFFNDIHIGRNIPIVGIYLMGVASILMIFLSLSGVIMWLSKRKKTTTKENFWFKWHKNITLALLPLILVFSFTGAVLGFMLSSATPLAYAASKTENTNLRALVGPILFPKDLKVKESKNAQMMKISSLQEIAQKEFPNLQINQIKLFAWNDINAKAKFIGYLKDTRSLSGRINRMHIEINAVNGKILDKKDLSNSNVSNKILSAFYFLHFIPDETIIVRVLYFIFGIIMTAGLGFGYLIYAEKRAKKNKDDKNYYSILNKLTTATMIGVIPASCLYMFLYWYLPFDAYERVLWLQGSFYSLWAGTLLYCILKDNVLKVTNHLLLLSSILLLATVALHGNETGFYPWISFEKGLLDIFFVDITLLVFALVFFIFYKKSSSIKFFAKYDGDNYENH